MNDSLGDRIKHKYEDRFRFFLPCRIPCMIRIDGKSFHTYTKKFDRPFDTKLSDAMNNAAIALAKEAQGFKIGFLQSDECSILLTDYDTNETEAWFNYNKSKIESVSASIFTGHFNRDPNIMKIDKIAAFDSRSFSLPKDDVSNAFLFRAKDWQRNSMQMYCRSFFSDKEIQRKGRVEQIKMLNSIGKSWENDLEDRWKNGSWIIKENGNIVVRHDIRSTYEDINNVVSSLI